MDDVDIELIKLLSSNGKLSAEKLGKEVGLTGNAVASRMKKMEESGVIMGLRTEVNLSLIGFKSAVFFCETDIEVLEKAIPAISTLPYLRWLVAGLDGKILLQTVSDSSSSFENHGKELSAKLGGKYAVNGPLFVATKESKTATLSSLDVTIIGAVMRNPNFDGHDIANKTNLVPRTVNKRLRRLIREGVVSFGVDFDLSKMSGYIPYHVLVMHGLENHLAFFDSLPEETRKSILWRRPLSGGVDLMALCGRTFNEVGRDVTSIAQNDLVRSYEIIFPWMVFRPHPLRWWNMFAHTTSSRHTARVYPV
ncbi:MAG: winged helix-turn-helix transcriptional regulator [Thermoprotei archaeon]